MRKAFYAALLGVSTSLLGPAASKAAEVVNVGVIPIVDVAPIYLGEEKGFFQKHGIDLHLQLAQGGAVLLPSVVSGQYQFGFSNLMSLLAAQSRGLDLKIVAAGVASNGEAGADFSAVVVPNDSPVHSIKDLEGKTVAINTLQNMGEVSIGASMRKAGGDPAKLHYVEIDFPNVPAAITNKRVDAGWVVEPFLTVVKDQGGREIASNFVDLHPHLMLSAYFTTAPYASQHPEVVKNFTDAINESLEYASAHSDEVRRIVPTYTRISPDIATKMALPDWPSKIDPDSINVMAQGGVQVGLLHSVPDISKLLQ